MRAENSITPGRFRNQVAVESTNTSVKSRLGLRRPVPYSRPETGRLSAKARLGPVIRHQRPHRLQPSIRSPRLATDSEQSYDDLDDQVDMVEIFEGELDESNPTEETHVEMESDGDGMDQRYVRAQLTSTDDTNAAVKTRLIDLINQKQLIVNLNETDEDDGFSPAKGAGKKAISQKSVTENTEHPHIPR
ncbi:unnamed protein product [Echinostoma caproni]|uniref:Gag-pol polyprotein n=1 Tax=Echinostoma caproni TaxID=27848 RepID=A0A183AI61_9TREM|nr:unnamed protein product [Echinostoma caproni]